MKSNQRIIKLAVALLLVLTTTFSLSSCLLLDFEIYQEILKDQFGNNEDNGQNKGDNNNENNNESNKEESTKVPEFYPGSQGSTENVPALQRSLLSTVMIFSDFNESSAGGSGVIYQIDKEKGDAYIITNQHVVFMDGKIADKITVYLYGMELETYAIKAAYVGGTTNYDIAVVKIEGSDILKNSLATAATLGKSADVRVFDNIYVVGNHRANGIAATQGIVSVRTQNFDVIGAENDLVSLRVMRVDAAVNLGSSGGGIYNDQGKLVGIVCGKTVSEEVENMGYAIPIDLAVNLAENILDHCDGNKNIKVNRALLGITISAKVIGPYIDENGMILEGEKVQVMDVSPSSLAYGQVQVDDVVNSITVDGVTVIATEVHLIPEHMLNARLGSKIIMNVTRGDATFDITFTITESAITLER